MMTMKSVVLAILLLLVASTSARGEDFLHRGILKGTEYYGFAGYEVGGSAPTSMPASIRGVNKLSLTPNLIAGFQMEKPLTGRIGLQLGLQFENKGMTVDSRVKNYHVAVERGGETLEGQFTGNVNVHATEWMFTVPLMATYKVGKVHLKAGPYVSYLTSCDFHGWAYNGYLREGDPTGAKVQLGETEAERGNFDFSDHMRRWHAGLGLGADWHISYHLGAFFNLAYTFNGIFKSDFTTVEETLHPIYGQLGITYRLR
ncbi:MAG: porin family protein [Sodaliphilus pleomorphus]|jgi:hypothetical protein|uniref:PorT family protein n=1 Tax=Sodaliphilus pleomorphus TaxID=2606626 RepID=A0A6L5XGG3_9BACT|nr:porin family protein [Sodaliphilus pleomorphus]MCI6168945.1 PorT family protein [Muribaculaceae bacterium]MDY6252646.1 porin family protein [Bacteroidales bacterium]MDD6474202.1 porin family protein [Sodaliphilus pleomorphus]MDD7066023.1 porin family protein [Sodaliphilus pleomorphus]MDY2832583.1 porin family protein [Sodaliphilus pleomorphus]